MVAKHSHAPGPAQSSLLADTACIPHPGPGLVGRWGDVILVIAEADHEISGELVKLCAETARSGGDGRTLSRRLAGFLTGLDGDVPPFAAAAPVADGLAVFVQGAAQVLVGDELTISGAESLSWVDRLVPWPVASLTISAGTRTPSPRGPYNLELGSIPGTGLTLTQASVDDAGPAQAIEDGDPKSSPVEAAPYETPADEPSPDPRDPSPMPDRWPGQAHEAPTFESIIIGLDPAEADDADPRPPLPVATEAPRERSVPTSASLVQGVYCKNGHFDDPRVLFCAVCGINMVQRTPVLTEGPRPPLGVLVLDDGSAFQLDADYVLGREPTHDADVLSGRLRGIVLTDDTKSVSRAHARIELRQWDVVLIDNSSSNGTYVAAEGDESWVPLPPGSPLVLTSGIRIRVGSRTLAFNSYRGE